MVPHTTVSFSLSQLCCAANVQSCADQNELLTDFIELQLWVEKSTEALHFLESRQLSGLRSLPHIVGAECPGLKNYFLIITSCHQCFYFMGVWERNMEAHSLHSVPAPAAELYLVIQDGGARRRKLHQDAMGATASFFLPSLWDLRFPQISEIFVIAGVSSLLTLPQTKRSFISVSTLPAEQKDWPPACLGSCSKAINSGAGEFSRCSNFT